MAVVSQRDAIDEDALRRATLGLEHRGPDAQRWWIAPHRRVGLGHARLSVRRAGPRDRRRGAARGPTAGPPGALPLGEDAAHPFTSPPVALAPDERLHQVLQDTLRGPVLASLPFYDRTKVVDLLDRLPAMDAAARTAVDPALMVLLSACVLHDRFGLAA